VGEDLFWCPKVLQRPQFLVDYQKKTEVYVSSSKNELRLFGGNISSVGAKRNKK